MTIAIWLVLTAVGGSFAGLLPRVERNTPSSYLPRSAPSTQAAVLRARVVPQSATPAVVVFASSRPLTPLATHAIDAVRTSVLERALPSVVGVTPLRVSANRRVATFSALIDAHASFSTITHDVTTLRSLVGAQRTARAAVTGPAGFDTDLAHVFAHLDTQLLLVTVALVTILLILIYRSPVLWLVPLVSVGAAASLAQAGVYALAKLGATVTGETVGILTVLLYGAGTDYALLVVARYRDELRREPNHRVALERALKRVTPSILTSGVTVIAALLCLGLSARNDVAALGPVAAVGIASALLAMLTLLPALLALTGRRVFWPRVPAANATGPRSFWTRLAQWLPRQRRTIWIAGTLALVALALGTLQLRSGHLANDGLLGHPDSIVGEQLLARGFPVGASAPAYVVGPRAELARAQSLTRSVPGVASVGPVTARGSLGTFTATLSAPPNSASAQATVALLRARLATRAPDVLVGGQTATKLDLANASRHDIHVLVPLIAAVVFVGLLVLLRSLVASLLLVASVVVSFLASLGLTGVLFSHLESFRGTYSSLPVLGFLFLVALGVDYSVFLMARVREAATRGDATTAVTEGVQATGAVITSAGVVLAGTFAVLCVLPFADLVELGFLVAFGVLLDTVVVRSLIVPALALELGDRLWWPSLPRRSRSSTGHRL